jgi:hypothetical protein
MGWFDHKRHTWETEDKHSIYATKDATAPSSVLVLERCLYCDGVRTIEYSVGKAPVIREGVKVTLAQDK